MNLTTELQTGMAMPTFARDITTEDLVRFAGASGDFSHQHWDHLYMLERGFDGVIVHGWFTFAVMCEALERWIAPELATLSAFEVRYHRMQPPGLIRCGGTVTRVADSTNKSLELDLWAEDASGARTTSAKLTLGIL